MSVSVIAWPLDAFEVASLDEEARQAVEGRRDGFVVLEHGALPNRRGGGYLPIVWENGRAMGDRWSARSLPREEAERVAELEARGHAALHGGDWVLAIGARP